MLKRLRIENYALVEKIEIDFGPGLTVLTGETGAGKSVVLGGLMLTLGGRADREQIRHGAPKAIVETTFDLSASPLLRKTIQQEAGIPIPPDLRLGRDIATTGAARSFADDNVVSVAKIRSLAPLLVDFHSQQGHRSLLDAEEHIRFLDSFAGLTRSTEKLAEYFHQFTALAKQLHEAGNNAASMRERLELVNFQIDELSKAGIRIGEEAELENERKRLESTRTLMETGQMVLTAVSETDNSVLSILSQLDRQLNQAATIDKRLSADASLLSETVINLNELTRNLESYLSRLEDNPERLDEINAREAELYRLRKKYSADEAGLLYKLQELQQQSLGAMDFESLIKNLTEHLAKARKKYLDLALEVSAARRKNAARLEKSVESQLSDLAMTKAKFRIEFQTEHDENGFDVEGDKLAAFPHGLENIEFSISTNPNEPLKPLVKIASGGEISRIMLALLSLIAGKYRLPTIIFDEIDTGIGGVTAARLAEKLKELSKNHQVIVISHLPAVASKADHHLAVSKSLKNGRNIISVKEVKGAELKQELARMAGKS